MPQDTASFSGSIADGSSETLSVTTQSASYVWVTLDDGTQGNTPPSYDIQVDKANIELSGDDFVLQETGVTDRSWRFPALGKTLKVTVTNQSGGSANFDIEAEAI